MSVKKVELNEAWGMALDKLDREAFPNIPTYPKEGAEWWVVGNPAGHVFGFAGIKDVGYKTAFLCRAYVKPALKGQGHHRALIRVRERFARKMGYHHLITYVHPLNVASANNLIKCGMLLYNPTTPYGVPGALYFIKTLKPLT